MLKQSLSSSHCKASQVKASLPSISQRICYDYAFELCKPSISLESTQSQDAQHHLTSGSISLSSLFTFQECPVIAAETCSVGWWIKYPDCCLSEDCKHYRSPDRAPLSTQDCGRQPIIWPFSAYLWAKHQKWGGKSIHTDNRDWRPLYWGPAWVEQFLWTAFRSYAQVKHTALYIVY